MRELPRSDCLIVAAATPFTADLKPDPRLLAAHCRRLMAEGCDGVALFGTTGEGAMIAPEDRMRTLEALLAAGLPAGRLILSVGSLAIPDSVALARHGADLGVAAVLLMPPCFYRGGITEDGTFRFFAAFLDRLGDPGLRLLLYHFPDISGVPVTPGVVRRLVERYGDRIAGVKDSGGDWDYTEGLLRRFSELSIFTGTEVHLPRATLAGARGTICGLANVIPRLLRRMIEAETALERRRLMVAVQAVDNILSRGPFIPALKAVIAARTGVPAWLRLLPPLHELALSDETRVAEDFSTWQAGLVEPWRERYRRTVDAPVLERTAG
jgi:4-hydroxy-tetrahydrodipicolinate synthase